ncbi:MAG: HK97 gp10 family phage protein [Oscillospiraceae bacterium]|jgi:hypothetical protein|nr:HK97 gp10 family phage protein [Oscillospiraceae bacterium]
MTKFPFEERLAQLRELKKNIPEKIARAQEKAIDAAVIVAAEMTPPNADSKLVGTDMRTGGMKGGWARGSQTYSEHTGNEFTVILGNNMDYAGYVNDGHRMDKHFVPGIMVNPQSGLIEKIPGYEEGDKGKGMMVGTKTSYIPGIHAKEYARIEYEARLHYELGKMLTED